MRNSRLFTGFRYRYPQSFLDRLAKELGIKWTKVEFKCMPADSIPVCPLPPLTGTLFYMEIKHKDTDEKV